MADLRLWPLEDAPRLMPQGPAERMNLLYALDMACSRLAKRHATHPLMDAVQADLPDLLSAAAGLPLSTDAPAAPTAAAAANGDGPSARAATNLQPLLKVRGRATDHFQGTRCSRRASLGSRNVGAGQMIGRWKNELIFPHSVLAGPEQTLMTYGRPACV